MDTYRIKILAYRILMPVLFVCLIVSSWMVYKQKPTLEASEYSLYAMDFPNKGHHSQVYVIALTEQEATSAARDSGKDITSVRKISVPILVVQ